VMKARITFIHNPEDEFSPAEQLAVSSNALNYTSLRAVREDKLTFGVDEIPKEVYDNSERFPPCFAYFCNSKPRWTSISLPIGSMSGCT